MLLFDNLSFNLILLSYLIISVPTAYFIQYLLQKFQINYHDKRSFSEDKNGFWIGVFERIILLTFIYLKQYDAIGFILTGKSFLRIVKENEAKKSEYILLGSMISFSIALIVGLFLQQVI